MERNQLPPAILVVFGASGDLTWRKLIPAIYNLYLDGEHPQQFAVLGLELSRLDFHRLLRPRHVRRSVRLIFDGKSNISFAGVCHYVPVQPSTAYRFSAWVRASALTTDQGIRFQLHSLGTQDTSTAVTSDVHGSTPWTRIELPWSSGKDVQELQVCLVRFPSEEAENKIQGTAWVDDVALVPEPAEHPKP